MRHVETVRQQDSTSETSEKSEKPEKKKKGFREKVKEMFEE